MEHMIISWIKVQWEYCRHVWLGSNEKDIGYMNASSDTKPNPISLINGVLNALLRMGNLPTCHLTVKFMTESCQQGIAHLLLLHSTFYIVLYLDFIFNCWYIQLFWPKHLYITWGKSSSSVQKCLFSQKINLYIHKSHERPISLTFPSLCSRPI